MPLYMDIHRLSADTTPEMVRDAHRADIEAQEEYGVQYRGYFYDNVRRTVVCLVDGPSPHACSQVHLEAHGMVGDEIIEVDHENLGAFLGGLNVNPAGEVLLGNGERDPGLRVLMVTLLANLADVGNRLGDAAALQTLECHDRVVREAVNRFGGREVQHAGDGMLLSFVSASAAVHAALDIQRACADDVKSGDAPAIRIGMAAGEPVSQHANLFGVAVEQARAIARAAPPGEILASIAVRELCAGKGLTFAPATETRLVGLREPIALAAVLGDAADAASSAPHGARGTTGPEHHLRRLRAGLATRYEIERELGRGGMATVYLARDQRHDRRVAIKVLRPELAMYLGTERFLKEIRLAAKLTHPNIVPLYDSGECGGILYYIMPHLEGETLRARIARERQLGVADTVELVRGIGAALEHAHRHGIIHRDVKPDNILLHEGQPMVLDFGVALALTQADGDRLTEPGLSPGTPAYMSPEQALGERDVDVRSDVYSFACVVYQMLSGDPPFTSSNVQALIARIITDVPTRLACVRPDVPEHLDRAVHRALAKAPADRFASAEEFTAAVVGAA
jgi:class 3 adenylate cyclase/tRNA A-37 threonylcarbamoyl transferase component Bud32